MDNPVRYVGSRDISLCVNVAGKGPNLLFIGGTGWDLRATPNPLESLLTKYFTVALFDQRGMGRSDKPDGPYTMKDYADDAIAVADALEWERPHIVGYSFGGMVAQEVAIGYPERVFDLILAASSPGGAGGSSYPVQNLLQYEPYQRALLGLEVSDLRFTKAFQIENASKAQAMVEKRMKAQMRFSDEPRALFGLKEQLRARAYHDCHKRLPLINARTLVVAGEDDGQAKFDVQEKMAKDIPRAKFLGIPGGHNFLFENNRCYREIVAFLAEPA